MRPPSTEEPLSPAPMMKATFWPGAISTTPPTGEGGRPPPVSGCPIVPSGWVLFGVPPKKLNPYARASPRLETHALVAAIGLFVEKYVVPATVSGEFTTFSPVARLRYQPLHIGGVQTHTPPAQVSAAALMPAGAWGGSESACT